MSSADQISLVNDVIKSWRKIKVVDRFRDPESGKWYQKQVQWVEMSTKESKEYETLFENHSYIVEQFDKGKTMNGQIAWPKRKWLLKQPIETVKFWKDKF